MDSSTPTGTDPTVNGAGVATPTTAGNGTTAVLSTPVVSAEDPALIPGDAGPERPPGVLEGDPTFGGTLGRCAGLSEMEQAELCACEEVIQSGWDTFVQVGLALGRIRDAQLYRVEFVNFDAYCRGKWQYSRTYVTHLICSARLCNHLAAHCSDCRPDNEYQVRPLLRLTADDALRAWKSAVEKANGRRVTARLVQAAVEELQGVDSALPSPPPAPIRLTKKELQSRIDGLIGELLLQVTREPGHEAFASKLETLHGLIRLALGRPGQTTA